MLFRDLVLRARAWPRDPYKLLILCSSIAAAILTVATTSPNHDPDVWWVAAAGREMLQTHAVVDRNLFSFTDPQHAWVMHEWLLGPPYAWLLGRFGAPALPLAALTSSAAAMTLIVYGIFARARRFSTGFLLTFASLVMFCDRFLSARPSGVALLFPLACIVLAFRPRFDGGALAASVGLELVWANAHGTFPLGILLLGVAAVEQPADRARRFAAVAAAAAVTLVNPYGLRLHALVLGYLRGGSGVYRLIHENIREFSPIHRLLGTPAVGPINAVGWLLVAALSVAALRRREYRVRAALVALLLLMAARQARHLELAGLCGCLLLVPYVDDLLDRRRTPASVVPHPRMAPVWLLLPSVAIALGAHVWVRTERDAAGWTDTPSAFARVIGELPAQARIFVPFAYASQVIWLGAPRGLTVFYDSRNDCYSAETAASFFALERGAMAPRSALAALRARGTDWALLPPTHPLTRVLSTSRGWSPRDRFDGWSLFARNGAAESELQP